jgi:hypothetical protein
VWITDFNNDVVWRYDLSNGQFTSFPVSDPADVAVDVAGNAWFTQPGDVNAPGTSRPYRRGHRGRHDDPNHRGFHDGGPAQHQRRLRWAGLVHRPVHAPGGGAPQPVQQLSATDPSPEIGPNSAQNASPSPLIFIGRP